MNMLQNAPVSEQTFTQFLFHNRRNRISLYLAAVAIILQFIMFKYLYPFANYIYYDSFFYLIAADQNLTINFYPIGYSKFLRLVSVFAKPDLALVSLQYLLIQCSTLFLLFTTFYFYKTGRVTQAVLLCFMVFNPLHLHLGNMVSSDGLFLALSMTWFALLLWIIYKPSNKIICWHAILLFIAFTVRYNALCYPFISLFAFWLSTLSLQKKVIGLGFALLLLGLFVGLSMFQYKKLTGNWQYSPFSGWLLAGNAIYAYQEIDRVDREPIPLKFHVLDNMVVHNFHTQPNLQLGWDNAPMWLPQFPLLQYYDNLYKKDTTEFQLKKWASMGPFYSAYGWYLIKKYPIHFLRYFIWPNSLLYIAPPVEFLNNYNSNQPTVPQSAVRWFGYINNQIKTKMKNPKASTLQPYPYVVSITNLMTLLLLLSYLFLKGWLNNTLFNKIIFLFCFALIVNAGFIILTCAAALRFQAFPILLNAIFSMLLVDWMAQFTQRMKIQSQ